MFAIIVFFVKSISDQVANKKLSEGSSTMENWISDGMELAEIELKQSDQSL